MATIRQEINVTSDNSFVSGFAQLDTTQYVNPTYYFECVFRSTTPPATISLRRKGTTTDDASASTSANGRVRSASFSPPAGQTEYFLHLSAGSAFVTGRIIIIDTGTITATQTQIEISGQGNTNYTSTTAVAMTAPKYWLYTAANWDGTKTFFAEVTYKTSSTNTATITLQEDNGSFASWVDKVTIVSAVSNATATRTRSSSFTPTDGRNYRIAVKSSTTKSFVTIYNAKVVVNQSASPTKFEAQYLLLTPGSTTTGLQTYNTLIDTTNEWSGVTNTYKHAVDSDNALNATKLEDITTTTILTTSAVTGANQQISSDMSSQLVSGDELDTDIITAAGTIAASRILVGVNINGAAATTQNTMMLMGMGM